MLRLFPVWVVLGSIFAMLFSDFFAGGAGLIIPMLMLIMLCMGLSLTTADFANVRHHMGAALVGMLLQFSVMPLLALTLSMILNLDQEATIGMVLLGSVAGGTSSNVMTYIAGGNVALSVSMTACSTLLSIFVTPLLLLLLVDSSVSLPTGQILQSLFQIILIPVSIGLFVNTYAKALINRIEPLLAPTSMILIVLVIAVVVALNSERIMDGVLVIAIATFAHNTTGLCLGYFVARLLRFEEKVARTIAIEVGMQNSGLATALAIKFFSAAAALPGAIFSIWLNITGSAFASLCRHRDRKHRDRKHSHH